ncbi:MAG TPA: hypothetical protein VEJ41_10700 [Candidatus Acidoferrales bacterium]|nr:hypothetical protein [Candidatus Acidoferrales bacterium]
MSDEAQLARTKQERSRRTAAWGNPTHKEPHWPAQVAVVIAIALYVTLPGKLTFGPWWLVPALEIVLLVPLIFWPPRGIAEGGMSRRVTALVLICIINLSNIASLGLLIHELLSGTLKALGSHLLLGAVQIWITNIIVFALWYWELDRGGPEERMHLEHSAPDFLFPQMVTPGSAPPNWAPRFVDYLFVSFTNATAFSPTDTMPLTAWAKMLFLVQASTSLLTVAIVAARAVNILT